MHEFDDFQRVKGKNEFTLEKGVVERYRRRLDNIRHSARKTDKNEVFFQAFLY